MQSSIFTKIIQREISAEVLWENEKVIVIMDAFPHIDGQVLVIPKTEVDHFFDLNDEYYNEVFRVVKWIAPKLKEVFSVQRVVVIIEGFEVPHVHVKLYPANNASQTMNKITDKLKSRIKENADKIREVLK